MKRSMRYERYTIIIEPDEEEPHRSNVRVPALPGCFTYGESVEDALANAVEAIQGYVAIVVAGGEPVPVERQPTMAATIAGRAACRRSRCRGERHDRGCYVIDSTCQTDGSFIDRRQPLHALACVSSTEPPHQSTVARPGATRFRKNTQPRQLTEDWDGLVC
jgi:predicted RNase H-like HicB family nuclease